MNKHKTPQLHKRIGKSILAKRRTWVIALTALVVAGGGVLANQAAHAAANTLYVAPSAGTYTVGDSVSIAVREDSGSTGTYTTQIGVNYPQSLLQFVSIDGNGSAFGVDSGLSSGGSGHVEIYRAATPPNAVTNDQLVVTLNFKVLASGSASVSFDPACPAGSISHCSTVYDVTTKNVITSTVGGTYTLKAATVPVCPTGQHGTPPNCVADTCPAGQTGTPPNCVTPTCPSGQTGTPPNCTTPGGGGSTGGGTGSTGSGSTGSTSTGTTTTTTKSTSTSITPKSSLTPIVAPDNSQVQISAPVDIQPTTVQADGVQKIQYYLNNKLVYTANAVPYTYHLDTAHLLNGTYTLKSIKFYISGRQETSTQKLVIKNPFSFIQFGLFLRHYLIEIIIPFLLIVGALVLVYFRIHRIKWYKGPGSSHIDTPSTPSDPTMTVQGPTVVTPSS